MNLSTQTPAAAADDYAPDGRYAFIRMGVSLLVATLAGVGMWAVIVVLPKVQAEFGVDRAAASAPYTLTMLGFAFGTITLGRLADRVGIMVPMLIACVCLALGFVLAGLAPSLVMFSAVHLLLIGIGAGGGFAPMMADISHWFVKRRGLAVVIVASGNYLAGALWPLIINALMPLIGWRGTYMAIGGFIVLTLLPATLFLRRRPSARMMTEADNATKASVVDVGVSRRLLIGLLMLAGFSCCTAMSMPQVHIVAYCGDLGYGVARGAEMLSLMLFLGIVSRIGSGFVADAIGGTATLLIGSLMQGVALLLYLYFDGLTSLYVVSGIFGLFQGGIVPMYAVICRELLPPREAGAKIGLLVSSTIVGMAFGGYFSGVIFDVTGSYRMAFLNGVLWNALNLAIVGWLLWRRRKSIPVPFATAA
ncbi:MAG TPA: MFS transporter [Aliidongia sp.]|uniref:MFS transporter n=1 Tax=Aliidongia sp. TaxID=1914230 RepID=UPI002DDD8D82|nr:MFS transporter [Aliidongia sp.]HEV2677389.1 MFS transporter [Aliidongia sp.]